MALHLQHKMRLYDCISNKNAKCAFQILLAISSFCRPYFDLNQVLLMHFLIMLLSEIKYVSKTLDNGYEFLFLCVEGRIHIQT